MIQIHFTKKKLYVQVARTPGYLQDAKSIEELLEERNVFYSSPKFLEECNTYPLEAFEDFTLGLRLPKEWGDLCTSEKGDPTPISAKALWFPSGGAGADAVSTGAKWLPCWVFGWDDKRQEYSFLWKTDAPEVPYQYAKSLALCVDGDDVMLFADRVAAAHDLRRKADALLKINQCVDSMPTNQCPMLPHDPPESDPNAPSLMGIFDKLAFHATAAEAHAQEDLVDQVMGQYVHAQNEIIFEKEAAGHEAGGSKAGLHGVQMLLKQMTKVQLQAILQKEERPVPEMGIYGIEPPVDLDERLGDFCAQSLRIRPEVCNSMVLVREKCVDLQANTRFFKTNFEQVASPENWDRDERESLKALNFLRELWMGEVRMTLMDELKTGSEKWFDLNETDINAYNQTPLKRFLRSMELMISDMFRSWCMQEQERFVTDLEALLPSKIVCDSINNVKSYFPDAVHAGQNKLIESLHQRPHFSVKVIHKIEDPNVEGEGSDGKGDKKLKRRGSKQIAVVKMVLDTPVEKLMDIVVDVFDSGLDVCADVPSIQQVMLPHLIQDQALSMGYEKDEQWIKDLRGRLQAVVNWHHTHIAEICEMLEPFQDIIMVDLEAKHKEMVERIENEGMPNPRDLKRDLQTLVDRSEEVLRELPNEPIVVGLISVDVGGMRKEMSDKLLAQQKSMLKFIDEQLSGSMQSSMEQFDDIFATLAEEKTTIEEVSEMQEYLATVPTELGKLQIDINDNIGLVDVAESFGHRFKLKKNLENISGT